MPASSNQIVRVGLIQHDCTDDPSRNLKVASELIRDAAGQGATIITTQELFTSLYFPQIEDEVGFQLAESIPGPTTSHLADLARELGVYITASLFERRTAGLYHNTSVMIDPKGQIIDTYRKMHIPDDPMFYEKYYFTPGDLGWRVQETAHARTGMLVCWDQWFPEAARLTALGGAQILFYPTAIGFIPVDPPEVREQQRDAWQTIQRAHAISNGVFVAAINRFGSEDALTFYGSSFVASPSGQIIAQAPRDQPAAMVVDCDLGSIQSQRHGWPFLRDRRIDAYADLTKRFRD